MKDLNTYSSKKKYFSILRKFLFQKHEKKISEKTPPLSHQQTMGLRPFFLINLFTLNMGKQKFIDQVLTKWLKKQK
jgi:hypothetical protein